MRRIKIITLSALVITSILSCTEDGKFILLSLNQEKEMGEETALAIANDPGEFPVLSETQHQYSYDYIRGMMNEILESDEINYGNEFDWEVTIIDKDVKNAFAVPGGKLYFYTGLLEYLENSAQLAGVMAHEIAHVDKRHSNQQITKAYGLDIVLSILINDDESQLKNIAKDMAVGIASLQFSQKHEYEADEYSIRYLMDTDYYAKGIKGFFEKLQSENHSGTTFEFLSTHPSDEKRIANIESVWSSLGQPGGEKYESEYDTFLQSLR